MAYKDSFVEDYPYLVYSDDPSAVDGAGGDSVAVDFESHNWLFVYNQSTRTGSPVFIMADKDGSKYIANLTLDPDQGQGSSADGFTMSRKAYIGLLSSMMSMFSVQAYVTETQETIELEPVGTHEGSTALTIFAGDPTYNAIYIRDKS
jgi:hypothetical protein